MVKLNGRETELEHLNFRESMEFGYLYLVNRGMEIFYTFQMH